MNLIHFKNVNIISSSHNREDKFDIIYNRNLIEHLGYKVAYKDHKNYMYLELNESIDSIPQSTQLFIISIKK